MHKYILAIDQGTTSSRAMLFNGQGQMIAVEQKDLTQFYPKEGWVEHDPLEIWQSILDVSRAVIQTANIQATDIAGIGITNQRETALVWHRQTGQPIYKAIVWQDRRTATTCQQLKQTQLNGEQFEVRLQKTTGLLLDPYFSATKYAWILDHVDGARALAEAGDLCAGTVDSYLLWHLTKGKVHATDATNACRTALFDIHKQQWDADLCAAFNVPLAMLPQVEDTAHNFGVTAKEHFGSSIPIAAMAGDQHAAMAGQACFTKGSSKCTYGTGCFLVLNTGQEAIQSDHRLLTTMAYRLNGEATYALEGSAFIAGAVVQWLRDTMGLFANACDSADFANKVSDDHSVVFVPAFTGLGAPYWDPHAKGAILGLSRNSGPNEITAAALESVCLQTNDLLQAMQADGAPIDRLQVDGGMVSNQWMMQRLADLTRLPVIRPAFTETTALGAAYFAGLQQSVFASLADIQTLWQEDQCFNPVKTSSWTAQKHACWQRGVQAVQHAHGEKMT